MLLERTSPLPFIDSFPIRVQIRIYSEHNHYMADINADWSNWHRFRIGLRPCDLEELNLELQQAIEEVSRYCINNDSQNDVLTKLARTGNFAFKRIFSEGTPREIVNQMLEMNATIQVSSEDFFIPWELLYDGPLDAQTDISRFWGMRHIVSRALIQDARPGALSSPTIKSSCPQVGLITYNNLEYVIGEEIPALQELHQQKKISLFTLRPLNANSRKEELEYVRHFLNDKELQIIHFACHAIQKKPTSKSYLLVSDEFSISIEDFIVSEFEISHKPLVILNACLTGTISPLCTSNWAALFWEHGARGVLATEFHVPDKFASDFIEELYKHILTGSPIGEALISTRRHFWEEQSNTLGLAYALYASPSIRIINSS